MEVTENPTSGYSVSNAVFEFCYYNDYSLHNYWQYASQLSWAGNRLYEQCIVYLNEILISVKAEENSERAVSEDKTRTDL
jgi:hypothetical protein